MSDAEIRDLTRAAEEGQPGAADKLQRTAAREGRVTRLEFFVATMPKQKGNSKKIVKFGGRMALIGDKKARAAQDSLAARVLEHKPPAPLTGPVLLGVTFVMPVPTSFPGWKKAAALEGRVYPSRRPDRGNLLKLLEDALEGPFYVDDAQVVDGPVAKRYGEVPGYRIVLEELVEATAPVRQPKGAKKKAATPAQDGAW